MDTAVRVRPPPLSRRAKLKIFGIVAVYAVAIGFGVALFSGSIPGLAGQYTSNVKLNGHEYAVDSYWLPLPQFGNTSTPPKSVEFNNVSFTIWTTDWNDLHAGFVHGNGTELTGSTYSFVLSGIAAGTTNTSLYVSPDAAFGAGWTGEVIVQLLVEVPSA